MGRTTTLACVAARLATGASPKKVVAIELEDLDDAPSVDQDVAHFPLLVGDRPEFSRTDRLAQVAPELLPHFDRIADVVAPAEGD